MAVLRFDELVKWGEKLNVVVERESRGYSIYSNSYYYEVDCATLQDVYNELDQVRDRIETDKADKASSLKYGF